MLGWEKAPPAIQNTLMPTFLGAGLYVSGFPRAVQC